MDMQEFAAPQRGGPLYELAKLRRHTAAIREHQLEVAEMLAHLHEDPPDAEGAQEILETLPQEVQIDLWSCSTKAGGIWETWQRDALKNGELGASYDRYCERLGIPNIRATAL